MNQRQLASVLFAMVGVFLTAYYIPLIPLQVEGLLPTVPDGAELAAPPGQTRLYILSLVGSALAVLISAGLIVWRDRLADRLFPPASQSLGSAEVQAVALSVLGCYFAVQGMSGLVDWGFRSAAAIQLVLGIGLFFGARGLSRLWSFGRGVSRGVEVP